VGRPVVDPVDGVPTLEEPGRWLLRLYVAGQSPKSLRALMNLKRICAAFPEADYQIEVVDLLEHPHLAARDQIIAIPTLVRLKPLPARKLVGDLSETERVVAGLDMPPR
jgi:circadian clock protein KaiB